MEFTLAILMVLASFVVIPAMIGFAIAGIFILSDRRALRAKSGWGSNNAKSNIS